MRKFRYLFILSALVAFAGCQAEKQPAGSQYAAEPSLSLTPYTVEFTPDGGSAQISVKADDLLVGADKPWLATDVKGSVVTVTAEANKRLDARYCVVTIVSGKASALVQVVQYGLNSNDLWKTSYDFTAEGGSVQLKYSGLGTPRITVTGSSWISAEAEDGILTITVAANEKGAREGSVQWRLDDENTTITIKQAANPSYNPGDDNPGGGGDNPGGGGDNPGGGGDNPGGGGDNPGGGGDTPGQVTIDSFVGSWTSSLGSADIEVLSEEYPLYKFTFSGFMDGEQPVPAFWDESSKTMQFYSYNLGEEGNWTYYFGGLDDEDYLELGGPDEDQMLASATLSADGKSFQIKGNEYNATYQSGTYHEVIVALTLFAYLSQAEGDYDPGYYSFNNVTDITLPVTFTKSSASGSSLKPASIGTAFQWSPAFRQQAHAKAPNKK